MSSLKGKKCRIKTNSQYFKDKYGEAHPIIEIEGTDRNIWGRPWNDMVGNIISIFYAVRRIRDGIPDSGTVYLGKINQGMVNVGELVHESELSEPIREVIYSID